jgi:TrmH family RNA methyltransferase
MAERVGSRAERLVPIRALRTAKGRREQRRFAFEGATLLGEALKANFPIAELYATRSAYESDRLVRAADAGGTPVFIVDDAASARISDLATPSGILAVAPIRLSGLAEVLAVSPVLVLADLNDPANAGTLLRTAEAFGVAGVAFGSLGVDPYHPKVVRGTMGAIFRLALAVADPAQLAEAAHSIGLRLLGLSAAGTPVSEESWRPPFGLVVGHERRGLARWGPVCDRVLAIPMRGHAESLSAAVAGSIALYEACRSALSRECSEA